MKGHSLGADMNSSHRRHVLAVLVVLLAEPSFAHGQTLDVVIHEIAWMGTTTDANDEWIELYNPTGGPVSLAGWTLVAADGVPTISLAGTIPAGGYFLLERTDDNSVPGITADLIYSGALGNTGETLSLRDSKAALQDNVDAWYAGNNTTKATMQRVDPALPGTLASNWTNGPVGGTPMNSGSSSEECDPPLHAVDCQVGPPFVFRVGGPMVINEVMINPSAVTDANGEYVELYNSGSASVDLQGWTLRDDGTDSFTIPTGSPVLVAPGDVFVVAAQGDPGVNGGFAPHLVSTGFFLSNAGDEVILMDGSAVEQDRLVYGASPFTDSAGESVERVSPRLPSTDPLSWVQARSTFGLGDRGTPGTVNTLQARRYVLQGTLVTMDDSLPQVDQVFPGRLYVQGNRVLDVLHAADPLPADATGAALIDTQALIYPGLMNIHDHIAFNTIPAWNVPALMQDVSDWTGLTEYQQYVRYPHEILTNADYYDLLPEVGKYAEVKALMAGTTSVQGSFPTSAGFTNHLARNVDLSNFGADRVRQRSLSVLDSTFQTTEAPQLVSDMDAGTVDAWLVHLGEGTAEDAPLEFDVLRDTCLLRSETVVIHGTALTDTDLDDFATAGGKLVIAPTSNYLYYGATANVPGAVQRGIPVALSTDWSPAGDKNLLASLKSVALLNDTVWNDALTERQIVEMVTTAPAKAMNWCTKIGHLRSGGFADIAVVAGDAALPYASLIAATEEDVLLTAVDGDPLFARPAFLQALKPGDFELLTSSCGFEAGLDVTDPAVLRGTQTFAQLSGLLQAASDFDFQHMKANFKDPTVVGMTDPEFQAYLDQRFPLGILARPLDPYWVIEDGDYFTNLQTETNVTALDPNATLDIELHWDPDEDSVLNACDNCPAYPNADQEAVVLGQMIQAASLHAFAWNSPADVRFVRGGLASLTTYGYDASGDLAAAVSLTDATSPLPGAGFYYLVRLAGSCTAGSWQSLGGAEPGRDQALP
jgi:cytosine/adenosine deaminase-related metal-dependent hydrolase